MYTFYTQKPIPFLSRLLKAKKERWSMQHGALSRLNRGN